MDLEEEVAVPELELLSGSCSQLGRKVFLSLGQECRCPSGTAGLGPSGTCSLAHCASVGTADGRGVELSGTCCVEGFLL